MSKEKEIAEEYASSLADLTVNSKPLINMLTILAEENVEHAGVIVDTVEKHLEKVQPDIKLPVLYLVDSIIKNVGGAYTQKFAQSIVNMFTRTFKQVDEKVRSQMFKLRETWHDVFPATKLYQLDVKVNLIDPAWPIQAQPQPHQANIHVNPNFLKKQQNVPATSATPTLTPEEEQMRSILAKKEQELLMLQQKKIEMQLEQTRRQLELAEKNAKKAGSVTATAVVPTSVPAVGASAMPVALLNPVAPVAVVPAAPELTALPVKARLGPPVNKPLAGRIAPVSAAMIAARRDPRLARQQASAPASPVAPPPPVIVPQVPQMVPHLVPVPTSTPIAPNVFDIKPLDRPTKRKNVITYEVQPEDIRHPPRGRHDPRFDKRTNRIDDRRKEKIRLREERRKLEEERRAERLARKAEAEKLERKAEIERLERKAEAEKLERKAEAEKLERKAEIEKLERKAELEKLERKSEIDKLDRKVEENNHEVKKPEDKPEKNFIDKYIEKIPDPKKINKLPPIPKINRDENKDKDSRSPIKRKKEVLKLERKKKKDDSSKDSSGKDSSSKDSSGKDSSSCSSPEKKPSKLKEKEAKVKRVKEKRVIEEKPAEPEIVAFKELKNYHKERYMRRNREKSESPPPVPMEEDIPPEKQSSNVPEMVESKDVDLRVLPGVEVKPASVAGKRPSTETAEGKPKKNKLDKFDILFGNEDVDLRQLPQVEETAPAPPAFTPGPSAPPVPPSPPVISTATPIQTPTSSPKSPKTDPKVDEDTPMGSPKSLRSPKKDWHEVKEKEEVKKLSKLDLVRAKLAEATKGKDRLGRPLLFSKSPSVEKERRRTISSEDMDLRTDNAETFDAEDHKKTISIIMNQAKEQYTDGQLDKNQYNTLMYQVLQLNEKLKLKEAKQRESLELSKQKLKAARIQNQNNKIASPKTSPKAKNNFGDIDERITPAPFMDTPPDSQPYLPKDSDMRMLDRDSMDGPRPNLLPAPPAMPPMFMPYGVSTWRGPRPRADEYVPRRFRPPMQPPFFRPKFEKRGRTPFERMPNMPIPPLPTPKIGMCQGESPLMPYQPIEPPPPLGAPGIIIPPTDFNILEYIDQDPVKTIQIDGIPREIRFYGDTAIIMLDWDDPREIKFLPGCRRVTFDNKDSVVLSFNEPYKQVEIDDQVFDIKFGAPTRELYINGRWWECFFGGQPFGVMIDGKPRLVHLEGPLPQVDIGKDKRTDLVAGKVNLIVNATQMCPVYLDAKVQKFTVNGHCFTIRFVDALKTVLINEQPFRVEFGDLPKPITLGNEKFFIRFSALPRNVKPGFVQIANMEGAAVPALLPPVFPMGPLSLPSATPMEVEEMPRPPKTPSPEQENKGLDMLASVMPSNMEEAPPSATEYSSAEPLFIKPEKIPGLETPKDEKPPSIPVLENINVNDLFAKLLATGIVQMTQETKKEEKSEKTEEVKQKPKEDKTKIHRVDLLRPETLRVKQPGIVAKLYGGMQCSGCGARFPPEHTVRYSQHLDWHFRQNRRERDSARRAHSRHWHYDLSDWVQYEEVEDLEEREKSWFETGGAEGEGESGAGAEPEAEAPSVAAGAPQHHHCALCGDKFDQFYNEDKEEWHLRNSVKHEDKNYHPMCFEDYKASLTKEEPPKEETVEIVSVEVEKEEEEPIAIDADDTNSQSDADDVVEVVEPEEKPQEPPVEIDEGDEDDVVLKAEPIEEVVVNDDADTDDETSADRKERDRLAEIDFSKVKVKLEPVDPDDEPIITAEDSASVPTSVDTTHTVVQSSIDGNVQLASAGVPRVPAPPGGGIRINISKSIPTAPISTFITNNICLVDDRMLEDISADDEPLPPGEEPELHYTLKPQLEGVSFSRQPPIQKGNELSGLCSIM